MTATLSIYMAKHFNIYDSKNHEFYLNIYYKNRVERILLNYSTIFDKRVGLKYFSIVPNNEVGVSFDTYMAMAGITKSS
jgi:hypothetical protein